MPLLLTAAEGWFPYAEHISPKTKASISLHQMVHQDQDHLVHSKSKQTNERQHNKTESNTDPSSRENTQ